jgi:ABC-type sulfate transport system permease component
VIYADIESGDPQSAAALSVVLMAISLVILFGMRALGGRVAR